MIRTQLADTADWLGRGLIEQVTDFSALLKPKLGALEKKFQAQLKQEGFEKSHRAALTRVSPLAAAGIVAAKKPLATFFDNVEAAGRELARRNVKPDEVTRALHICNEVIDSILSEAGHETTRDQLGFCTVLALNHAYYEVKEAESRVFLDLIHLEDQSPNLDVLYRHFIESMAGSCGAVAAHVYLVADDGRHWRLAASTAKAASPHTLAVFPATAAALRLRSKRRRLSQSSDSLDKGWSGKYSCIWSMPFGSTGVMQFAFAAERELLDRELEMIVAASGRCESAAKKSRLLEDIVSREERLSKLAIRMLMVEENERRRISRELHDDAGQSLVVIRLQMEMIEQALPEGTEERENLAEARDITEKTILDLRRLIGDLSPAVLEQLGLGAALRQLAHRFRDRNDANVRLNVGPLPAMDTNFQLVIYRLAQECFNNIAQHSQATTVNISLMATDKVLRLNVEDNGVGFDVEPALDRRDCFGLVGIRERVAVLGGRVSISSTPKVGDKRSPRRKSGTVIEIELPIHTEEKLS